MTGAPTFTQYELASGFALLMSPSAADRWAREWFSRFADIKEIDELGRYLYQPLREDEDDSPNVVIATTPLARDPGRTGYEQFSTKSDDEIGEYLMSFSDFHLTLVSLASSDAGERVRAARGDTQEAHESRCAQMRRIVESIRPRRTLED